MRDDLKNQGYSKEDEYFHRKDQELVAKLREKAEAHTIKATRFRFIVHLVNEVFDFTSLS